MPKPLINIVYILLVAVGLVAMYSILNAGNPNSLLRPIFPDPAKDIYVAMGSSLFVFVLGFVVFFNRDSEGFRNLIEMNAERIRQDRLQAHAIEAAEQCGGTYVPEVAELKSLSRTLDDWPTDRQIMFCDEELAGTRRSLPAAPGPWAILIGPEGGFSQDERRRLAGLGNAHAVGLGPRVLRADTAAVAALTVWQQTLGDWQ